MKSPTSPTELVRFPEDERRALAAVSPQARADIEEFFRHLDKAMHSIQAAGKCLANLSEEDWRAFLKSQPRLKHSFLDKLRRVGLGLTLPQIAEIEGRPAWLVAQLPVELQSEFVAKGVPVVCGREVKRIDLLELDSKAERQAFEIRGGKQVIFRDPAKQRSWLSEEAERERERRKAESGRGLHVERPGLWTFRNGRIYLDPELAADAVKHGLEKETVEQMRREWKL